MSNENKKTNLSNFTTTDLYEKHMKKQPSVLKLKLSLDMNWMDEEDMETLRKWGKMDKAITREVLVPADITLHALSYVIMRSFGWQNSHLHQFRLPNDVFQMLTDGKATEMENGYVKHDGLFLNWIKLCGIYFRFPCDDFEDLYWDDDYCEGQSFKSWLKRKYTGPYSYGGQWEHYSFANFTAKSIIEQNPMIQEQLPFDEWMKLKNAGKDPSKLPVKMKPVAEATIADIEPGFEARMDELLERLPLIELLVPQAIKVADNILDQIHFLQKYQEKTEDELPVIPVAHELIYAYDFGDGWEVKITLTDCYYTQDDAAFDQDNDKQKQDLADQICSVEMKHKPICIALDGMPMMDDVGGIGGYINFLNTIHGDDPEERENLRNWARYMGWTGRLSKPETLL